MNLCIHDLPADQCALCTGAAGAEHDTGQRKNMAPYDEPDEHGNTRWYQVWWDSFPTSVGPAEIELVSEPAPRMPVGGQPAWIKTRPVTYRVRLVGQGPGDWKRLHFETPPPASLTFRAAIEHALTEDQS